MAAAPAPQTYPGPDAWGTGNTGDPPSTPNTHTHTHTHTLSHTHTHTHTLTLGFVPRRSDSPAEVQDKDPSAAFLYS